MRKAAFAGLFACVCVFAYSPSANAEAFEPFKNENEFQNSVTRAVLDVVEPIELETVKKKQAPVEPVEPKVKKHVVADGETLESIASAYNTSWKRLYDKNESIESPDLIVTGDDIIIPNQDEELEERQLPVAAAAQEAPAQVAASPPPQPGLAAVQGFSAGNTYTPGQCTWHVKNLRGSSLPNGLGNADQWYYNAQMMGLATGTTPRVGAAGVSKYGSHAVYVTEVHANGTITVSEMNYNWTAYQTRTAVKNASDFYYIY